MHRKIYLALFVMTNVIFLVTGLPTITMIYEDTLDLAEMRPIQFSQSETELSTPVDEDSRPNADLTYSNEQSRDLLEQRILASIMRFEMIGLAERDRRLRIKVDGHGTVMGGRCLVVHNHFGVDLALFGEAAYGQLVNMIMYDGAGNLILKQARPPLFTVALEEEELLLLDFETNVTGEGFFDSQEVLSATLTTMQDLALQPEQIVAQVVWTGEKTDIDWVEVEEVIVEHGPPRVELANLLNPGSSGGGVFLNGYPIAVNWQSIEDWSNEGELLRQFSTAALIPNYVTAVAGP